MCASLAGHSPPLCNIDRLHNPGYLIDECDSPCDMVECTNITYLLPRHGHILQVTWAWHGACTWVPWRDNTMTMGEYPDYHSPQVDTFVIPELPMCHVTMVTNNLPDMLRRHVLLLGLNKPKLSLLTVTLWLQLLPFASCEVYDMWVSGQ